MVVKFLVHKATGETEEFSEYKLNHSLKQAGVEPEMRQRIIAHITGKLKSITTTDMLHDWVYDWLQQHDPNSAARYNLRKAIMELGPTGFPFERYFASLLAHQGYQTAVDQVIHGQCVNHEVDIVATKEKVRYMMECKYHNQRGGRSDIKTVLYIWARFEDIHQAWKVNKRIEEKFHEVWLVTNTKVTTDAEQYAKCRGMTVISWYRPYRKSLKDMIVSTGHWPITCLMTLSQGIKQQLVERNIVLCRDLVKADRQALHGLGSEVMKTAQQEAEFVCQVPYVEVPEEEGLS